MKCLCGCDNEVTWLISGTGIRGDQFYQEPACDYAAEYCERVSSELGFPFYKELISDIGEEPEY